MSVPVLIAALLFAAVFLLVLSIHLMALDLRQMRKERFLAGISAPFRSQGVLAENGEPVVKESRMERLLAKCLDVHRLEAFIRSTRANISPRRFLALSACCGLILALFPLFLFFHPLLFFMALAVGFSTPTAVLMVMRSCRDEAMVAQLPDAIDTIVRSLRAGHSVDAATLEVARNFPPPIGTEFRNLHEEMAMGLPFETVLKNFQRRFPRLADVRILCVTFIIQRETGGNLTEILAGLAATIRERFRLKRQVKAATAEGRATAVILGIMPAGFALLVWFLKPDYVNMFLHHPTGRKLLMVVIVMELTGFLLMRALSKVRV
ncbi:MAG: hypothetical protein GX443_11610 [Deltaproteobacteria bacterium]|nr:hypothetical protein [Deltaproteobacteria bacterium]